MDIHLLHDEIPQKCIHRPFAVWHKRFKQWYCSELLEFSFISIYMGFVQQES